MTGLLATFARGGDDPLETLISLAGEGSRFVTMRRFEKDSEFSKPNGMLYAFSADDGAKKVKGAWSEGYDVGVIEVSEIDSKTVPEAPEVDRIGFSGKRLLELLEREKPEPIVPGIPVPGHFQLLIAPAFTGKTSLILWTAMSRASAMPAWEGAPAPHSRRVLILAPDESVEQIVRRMNSLATFHKAGPIHRYADRIVVIGPDRDADPEALDGIYFDEQGLARISGWLEEAKHSGGAFAELYIDSYADLLPPGESENSNEEATRIGGALERLAVKTGAAIVVVHHAGKPKPIGEDELPDVRFLGRGASALAAKARIISTLEAVTGAPHLRRIRVLTNLAATPRPQLFEVCPESADTEELLYFRPHDPVAAYDPAEILGQEPISTTELAWRLSGAEPEKGKSPAGEFKRLAAWVREEWRRRGLVEVHEGPRSAKMISLAGPKEELDS